MVRFLMVEQARLSLNPKFDLSASIFSGFFQVFRRIFQWYDVPADYEVLVTTSSISSYVSSVSQMFW